MTKTRYEIERKIVIETLNRAVEDWGNNRVPKDVVYEHLKTVKTEWGFKPMVHLDLFLCEWNIGEEGSTDGARVKKTVKIVTTLKLPTPLPE